MVQSIKKYKILLYEKMHPIGTKLLAEQCELVYAKNFEEATILNQVSDVDGIIIRANGSISKTIIESAKNLKVIGRHGAGLDNIDVIAAKKNNVHVVYTPGANSRSVAEHFVGLTLNLSRKLIEANHALKHNHWNARNTLTGVELSGKTLGILGLGKIGKETVQIMGKGFGMKILYNSTHAHSEFEAVIGAEKIDIESLFRKSDLISINLPLNNITNNLVNGTLIKLMKPTAYLINMARGKIWNEQDLYQALKHNRIAGAASDVFCDEPVQPDNPLFELDNFIGSPHMSAHTEESMIKMSLVAEDVLSVLTMS